MAKRVNAADFPELENKMVALNRVSKTVKGGRIMKFSALCVVGDGKGRVGYGEGKASEVSEAIRKGLEDAKKHIVNVTLEGTTIPHEVIGEAGAGRVLLMPAPEGTGVLAGGAARAVLEAAGIKTKILVFDHNYNFDDVADQRNYPLRIYEDPEAAKYVAGSAWHNYGGNVGVLANIHGTAPDKEIYFTEASIGTWNYDFAKCLVEDFKSIFIQTMQNWGKGVTLWNLMLDDQKGPNRPGGCTTCFGAVTLSSSTNKVSSRNSHYYNVAHASKVIKQGAVRIATSGYSQTGLMYLAFQNPDGSYAVIASNSGSAVADVVFRSQKEARMIVPPGAIASMTWKD